MQLNEIIDNHGARPRFKRVGRGIGSGKGKTCGRGGKGQTARSGVALKGFEGGQMPLYRRLPKRGFNNFFAVEFSVVNLDRLQQAIDAGTLDAKKPIDEDVLVASGVLGKRRDGVKLLGNGTLKAKIKLTVTAASKSAIAAVEKAGGSVALLAPVETQEDAA
ncbi:MAG: 50S ribosomal protein L15 [Holosporales bacterium]|jgi:large subunit ribosomal protein L15